MSMPLKAGIIGFGCMGRLHARACQDMGVEVAAVAEVNEALMRELPPGIQRFTDYCQLLASDLDVVSICLPTGLHCRVTLDALAAGKHVLLEKPIARSSAEAQRMIAAACAAGRRLFVGMTHRFYPEVREAKALVDSGAIGEIVLIRDCIFEHFGLVNSPSWYFDAEMAGGGTVLSSGIHLVDRVIWFMGEQPVSVSGQTSNLVFGREVEDAAQMSLGFASRRSAQITFALLRETHPLVCDLEIVGTRGSIVVHTWKGLEHRSAEGVKRREIYTTEAHSEKVLVGLRAEVEELRASIVEKRDPRPSAGESACALRVIEEFYRSAGRSRTETQERWT